MIYFDWNWSPDFGALWMLMALLWLLFDLGLVLALGAFHSDAPPLRARPWLVAALAGVVVIHAVQFWPQSWGMVTLPGNLAGILCLIAVGAGLAQLIRSGLSSSHPHPERTLALAIFSGVALIMQLSSYLYLAVGVSQPELKSFILAGLVEALAVLVVGIPLAWQSISFLRALPAVTYQPLVTDSARLRQTR